MLHLLTAHWRRLLLPLVPVKCWTIYFLLLPHVEWAVFLFFGWTFSETALDGMFRWYVRCVHGVEWISEGYYIGLKRPLVSFWMLPFWPNLFPHLELKVWVGVIWCTYSSCFILTAPHSESHWEKFNLKHNGDVWLQVKACPFWSDD